MYCPVDGIEWREGITRCPEHDVDLVDEPPEVEEDEPLLGRLDVGGLGGAAVAAAVVGAVVYALSGVFLYGWTALASTREWTETRLLDTVEFLHLASSGIALGALGCLAAGVLGRVFGRLAPGSTPEAPLDDAGPEDDDLPASGAMAWVVTLLTSFAVVFALVWAVTGVAVSWDEAKLRSPATPFPLGEPSESFVNLSALNNAAYVCGLSSLVCLGAVLMARAYDRLVRLR
ncbi:MAG TPA: hypothetical protein VHN37_00060 [Actinomycetota bacterium]|nr:hypothetical protein [Actinomycetota bacterium]